MYFDLHLHPSLKSFLSDDRPEKRDDCWTTYRNCIDFTIGNIVDSQSSLRQIARGNAQLAVAAIYTLEDGLDEIRLLRGIAPIVSHLDRDMIRHIRPADYYDRFLEEVRHLEGSLEKHGQRVAYELVSAATEVQPGAYQLVLGIEGAHILKRDNEDDPLPKLDAIKNFRHKVFYLTPLHFTRNTFCTHAFAMKLVNPRKVPKFLPSGTGLTEEGKRVIRRAYADEPGRRVLIDVKHMGISGRRQFYDWKRTDPDLRDLPLIASHVGVTGISWQHAARDAYTKSKTFLPRLGQWAVTYRRPAGLSLGDLKSAFNPTSINLYDEDILEIIRSGGLIGLMMDQRQLGVSKKPFEYFAAEDYAQLSRNPLLTYERREQELAGTVLSSRRAEKKLVKKLTRRGRQELFEAPRIPDLSAADDDDDGGVNAQEATPTTYRHHPDSTERLSRTKRRHLLHLVNNLLHIARIGGPLAWRHVAIGSDYDGLVDAPNVCRNVTEFRDLEAHLYDILQELIREHGKSFVETYHLGDVRAQIRWLMYENGVRFVREWL